MKQIIILTTFLFFTFTSCTDTLHLPVITEDYTRGLIDEGIIKDSPGITYVMGSKGYTFSVKYPKVLKGKYSDYNWFCKWTTLVKKKAGAVTYVNQPIINLVPIDFLSVTVEVYCQSKSSGIKSKITSSGMVVIK